MYNGQSNSALESVVEEELSATSQVVAVVDQHRHVLTAARQLEDLKPDDEVVLRVDLVCSGAGVSSILAAPDGLADRDGRRKEPPWWSSCTISSWLRNLSCSWSWLTMLLVVAVHLKDDRLALHVLDERPGVEVLGVWMLLWHFCHLVTVTVMFWTW